MKNNISFNRRWGVDLTGAGICLAATLAFYFIGIQPMLHRYTDLASQESTLKAHEQIALNLGTSLKIFRKKLVVTRQTLSDSPFQLKSSADVNMRIDKITTLAKECGLKLDELRPDSPTTGPRYETVPIYLTGIGNYRTCVALLHRLRRTFPDTTITSFELAGNPSNPKAAARFRISLLWYAAAHLQARSGG